jgi:ribosomal-protein-alanine N-acetyltransferase
MTTPLDLSTFPELTTPRLILRQLTHADAEAMMRIFGDPAMLAYLNIDPVTTPEKAVGLIDWLNGLVSGNSGVQWAFALRTTGEVIGTGGAAAWDPDHRKVDIGYHIAHAHWGHGYATEAARAMIGWCFHALNVHRVQADCTEGNIASERVMQKCGLTYEGTWRENCWEHGRFVNLKQYGLLVHEYRAWVEAGRP